MKRLILVMSAAIVFAAEAKVQKICEFTLADQQQVVNAVNKVGEFINNPMLGMSVSALWSLNPVALDGVGAMRADGKLYAAVYVEGYKNGDSIKQLKEENFHFVALYPASCTKKQFLEIKPDAKETDGVIDFSRGIMAAFAEDGKYVAFSDKPELAKKALTGIAKIPKLPRDRIMSIRVTPAGMNMVCDAIDAANKELMLGIQQQDLEMLKSTTAFTMMCGAGPYGIDMEINTEYKPGSPATKLGNKPLSAAKPLAFAGKDSIFAVALAEDSIGIDLSAQLSKLVRFANKWGIETHWLKVEKIGANTKFILDLIPFCAYMGTCGEKKIEELSKKQDEILADFSKTFDFAASTTNPEHGFAYSINGAKFSMDAQSRFNRTLPGYSKKPCTSVGVWSIYGTAKSVMDIMFSSVAGGKELSDVAKNLPDASGSAIAFATMHNGPCKEKMIIRMNPAEVTGLYSLISVIMDHSCKDSSCLVDDDED